MGDGTSVTGEEAAVRSTSDMSERELEDYLDRCTEALKNAVREYSG